MMHSDCVRPARRLAGWVMALGVVLGCASAAGKRAPDPGFKSLDGQTHKLSSLRGQVVVVNFWATWCGPCQEELPRLAKIAESYRGKPVRFVLVSIDEPKTRVKIPEVLDRLHIPLASWDDADTDTMDRFGLGNIVPGTVILDEQGEVMSRIMGEAREEDVRGAVDWLLGGRSGPAPAALTKRY
jgi:thiol-disulfide isomerase/thioredoxin